MWKLVCGDVVEVMSDFPDDYFDAILSDVPYGQPTVENRDAKFAGDIEQTSFLTMPTTEAWLQMLRVLKPGGNAMIFGGSKVFHHNTVAAENAGFEIRELLLWLHNDGGGRGAPGLDKLGPECEGRVISVKPCFEPVVWMSKPRTGTYAENYKKFGVYGLDGKYGREVGGHNYPKNVMFDEETHDPNNQHLLWKKNYVNRAFHTGKVHRPEREAGLEEFDKEFRGKSMGRHRTVPVANWHPTLKPISLCTYLARMARPPVGRPEEFGPSKILIPYAGVASEMIGAVSAGWDSVTGIEIVPEFCEIGEARLTHWASL